MSKKELKILNVARMSINSSSLVKTGIYRQRGNPSARWRLCAVLLQQPFELHHWNERPLQGGVNRLLFQTHETETSSSLTHSSRFQVHGSKVAIEEGLMPEKLSEFDRAEQVRN